VNKKTALVVFLFICMILLPTPAMAGNTDTHGYKNVLLAKWSVRMLGRAPTPSTHAVNTPWLCYIYARVPTDAGAYHITNNIWYFNSKEPVYIFDRCYCARNTHVKITGLGSLPYGESRAITLDAGVHKVIYVSNGAPEPYLTHTILSKTENVVLPAGTGVWRGKLTEQVVVHAPVFARIRTYSNRVFIALNRPVNSSITADVFFNLTGRNTYSRYIMYARINGKNIQLHKDTARNLVSFRYTLTIPTNNTIVQINIPEITVITPHHLAYYSSGYPVYRTVRSHIQTNIHCSFAAGYVAYAVNERSLVKQYQFPVTILVKRYYDGAYAIDSDVTIHESINVKNGWIYVDLPNVFVFSNDPVRVKVWAEGRAQKFVPTIYGYGRKWVRVHASMEGYINNKLFGGSSKNIILKPDQSAEITIKKVFGEYSRLDGWGYTHWYPAETKCNLRLPSVYVYPLNSSILTCIKYFKIANLHEVPQLATVAEKIYLSRTDYIYSTNLYTLNKGHLTHILCAVPILFPNLKNLQYGYIPFSSSESAEYYIVTCGNKAKLYIYTHNAIKLDNEYINEPTEVSLTKGTHVIQANVCGIHSKITVHVVSADVVQISAPSKVWMVSVSGDWGWWGLYNWRFIPWSSNYTTYHPLKHESFNATPNYNDKILAPGFTVQTDIPVHINLIPLLPRYMLQSLTHGIAIAVCAQPPRPSYFVSPVDYVTTQTSSGVYKVYVPTPLKCGQFDLGACGVLGWSELIGDIYPLLPMIPNGSNIIYVQIMDGKTYLGSIPVQVNVTPKHPTLKTAIDLSNPPRLWVNITIPYFTGTTLRYNVPKTVYYSYGRGWCTRAITPYPINVYLNNIPVKRFNTLMVKWSLATHTINVLSCKHNYNYSLPLLPGQWNIKIESPLISIRKRITIPLVYSPARNLTYLVKPAASGYIPVAMSVWGTKRIYIEFGSSKYYVDIPKPGTYILDVPTKNCYYKHTAMRIYIVPSSLTTTKPYDVDYIHAQCLHPTPTTSNIPSYAQEYLVKNYSIINGTSFMPGTEIPLIVHIFKGHTILTTVKIVYANMTYDPTGNYTQFSDPNITTVSAPFEVTAIQTSRVTALACNGNGCDVKQLQLNVAYPPQSKVEPLKDVRPGVHIEITSIDPFVYFDYQSDAWAGGVQCKFKAWVTGIDALSKIVVTSPVKRVYSVYPKRSFSGEFVGTLYYVPSANPFTDTIYISIRAYDAYGLSAKATGSCTLHFPGGNPLAPPRITKKINNTTPPSNKTAQLPTPAPTPTPTPKKKSGRKIEVKITNKASFVNPVPVTKSATVDFQVLAQNTYIKSIVAYVNGKQLKSFSVPSDSTSYTGSVTLNLKNYKPGSSLNVSVVATSTKNDKASDYVIVKPSSVSVKITSIQTNGNTVTMSISAKAYGTSLTSLDVYRDGNLVKDESISGTSYTTTPDAQHGHAHPVG